mgnify:FL=1
MRVSNQIKRIKVKIIPTLKEYHVTRASIFGSYARGEQSKKSDVDILIEIDRGTDLIELIRLRTKLQKIIKRKVDLVEYASIRKELKDSILNNQVPIL